MQQTQEKVGDTGPRPVYLSKSKPRYILEQVSILKRHFSVLNGVGLHLPDSFNYKMPNGCEGLFAIPDYSKIASTYEEALMVVLDVLKKVRSDSVHNLLDKKLDVSRLRQSARTTVLRGRLSQNQGNSLICVVPAQLGSLHSGLSPKEAEKNFDKREFGLGSFDVAIILLTHPELLQSVGNLGIYCVGDMHGDQAIPGYYPDTTAFSHIGSLNFHHASGTKVLPHMGAATGFLPFPVDHRD
jgi:hypothetical protein